MNSQQLAENFKNLFEAACVELFQSLDCEITPTDPDLFDAHDEPCARIDGGCDEFEVELYLCMPYSTLLMTHPLHSMHNSISETDLEDWLCELSNLLIGRLKRIFSSYNFNLSIGLPDFLTGHSPTTKHSPTSISFTLNFETGMQAFEAGMTIELLVEDLALVEQENNDKRVKDGDIDFF